MIENYWIRFESFSGNLELSKDRWVEFDICRVLKMFEGGPPILNLAHKEDQFKNLIAIFSQDVYWEEILYYDWIN